MCGDWAKGSQVTDVTELDGGKGPIRWGEGPN